MKDHGYAEVALSRIVLPGDFTAYIAAHKQEVDDLSGARKALLLAHAPTVRKDTMELVAGRRRLAGLLNDSVKRTWVHLVDGTPAELRRLTASENLHRGHRDDLAQLRAAYVEETAAEVEQEWEFADKGPRKPGRPKTAKGEARERAARELGTTPEALRKVEERAVAKVQPPKGAAGGEPAAPPAPPIEMHDIVASADWQLSVAFLVHYLTGADQALRKLQGESVAASQWPAVRQAAKLALQEAAARVRALQPHCACVFCRDADGTAGRRAKCSACGDLGYLTAEQAQRIPPEQLLAGAAPVVKAQACQKCGGNSCVTSCRYDSRGNVDAVRSPEKPAGWPAPPKPPARRRGLQIEINGKTVPARELTIEREPGADDGVA